MKAFAVIREKSAPAKTISVKFREPIIPTLEIQSIRQPTPNRKDVSKLWFSLQRVSIGWEVGLVLKAPNESNLAFKKLKSRLEQIKPSKMINNANLVKER